MIKEGMATLDAIIKDYTKLFEKTMDIWTSLQEDPTLQKIGKDLREKQQQFDEIRLIACTLVPIQRFMPLQEGKQLQMEIEELRRKEAILRARTQPWKEESRQLTLPVQNKLKGIQQTQRKMGLMVEGPTTKTLIEEVQHATMQGTSDLQVLKMEFCELQDKIAESTK